MGKKSIIKNRNYNSKQMENCSNVTFKDCSFEGSDWKDVVNVKFIDCSGFSNSFLGKWENVRFLRCDFRFINLINWDNFSGKDNYIVLLKIVPEGLISEYPKGMYSAKKSIMHYELAAFTLWVSAGLPCDQFSAEPSEYVKTTKSHAYLKRFAKGQSNGKET